MERKNISNKYRPLPFWSWNEKLQVEETREQVDQMARAGLGGFFMHARGGLQTPYMGEEWFENITAAIEEAERHHMRPWAYDENGWPSGFGNGAVNGIGAEYQQKYLRIETVKQHEETYITQIGDYYFYYDVNPFYVDLLDKKVVAKFIECSYEPYYQRYGNRIEGMFTDEPQLSREGIPWSFVFREEYAKRYDENILDVLDQLLFPVGDYRNTRVKFWKMVTDLFSESCMKQLYEWCDSRGLKLTGHMLLEDHLEMQVEPNGACMPHYEYFHIPGMDFLGRNIGCEITPLQVSSVAEQLGKEAVLSETFALCGHNVSFSELKGIYEWQMVRGVNLLCQHLEGYSIRGIRKRDYPPAMYIQQPWWDAYDRFNDAMSRIGSILCQGARNVEVLVLEPQTTVWSRYDTAQNQGVKELHETLVSAIKALERKHIEFHLGDETILERHGKVENGKLIVGKQAYSKVILPGCEMLLEPTKRLLEQFCEGGGKIVTVEEIPENRIIDHSEITYTRRIADGVQIHYFVNSSAESRRANIAVRGRKLNIYTGELEAFTGAHEFEPWGSLMLFEDGTEPDLSDHRQEEIVRPTGLFKVVGSTWNSLTLDHCDYYFDGKLQEKNGYVLNIAERANELGRKVHILQNYHVEFACLPETVYLACETPEKFIITVNGNLVTRQPEGCFRDKCIQKIDISEYILLGENTISFQCAFKQNEEFYENLKKAKLFESEKNKLVYDMEIEPVYLLGDFRVRTDGEWEQLERNAVRYHGPFVIDAPPTEVRLQNLEKQGYPFFCGTLVLEGELEIKGGNPVLQVETKGIHVLKVEINGMEKILLTGNKAYLNDFHAHGRTKVKFTIINNLRNLMGPHHLEEGESYFVGPFSFFQEDCIWNFGMKQLWNPDYCFVETSIEFGCNSKKA